MHVNLWVIVSVDAIDVNPASGIPIVTVCGVTADFETAEELHRNREAFLRTKVASATTDQRWWSVRTRRTQLG